MKNIRISAAGVTMDARLNDSVTAGLVWDRLPLTGRVNTWGDEIYFEIPVTAGPENAVDVVEEGDLAYWAAGSCFCIFFGKTPASTGDEIRPASPVNPLGKLLGDPKVWKAVRDGASITLEKVPGTA